MNRELSVVIAEDQVIDREKLEIYAKRLDLKVLGSSGSGDWFVEDCQKYDPDLVFLDIGLSDTDGISSYKRILDKGINPYLIMVSGTQDYNLVLAGLEMNCIDFVSKPVTFERLQIAVEKAKSIIEKDNAYTKTPPGRTIQLKSNYRTLFINENKFIYAQKMKGVHKVKVFVEDKVGVIEASTSLTDIQAQCTEHIYAPNQSSLINFKYISAAFPSFSVLGTYKIKMNYNDIEIDLSRRNRKDFEAWFARLSREL